MFRFNYSLLASHLLLLALCSTAVAAFSLQKDTNDRSVTVTEQHNGETITVSPEDTIVVRLKSQMGTGYGWHLKTDDPRLKLLDEPDQENTTNRESGGVEHQVFRFKAVRPGTVTLELVYIRAWEKTAKPAKTFRLKVRVQ